MKKLTYAVHACLVCPSCKAGVRTLLEYIDGINSCPKCNLQFHAVRQDQLKVCPTCEARLELQPEQIGKITTCPMCSIPFSSETKDQLQSEITNQYLPLPSTNYVWRFQGKKNLWSVAYKTWRVAYISAIIVGTATLVSLLLPRIVFWSSVIVVCVALFSYVYARTEEVVRKTTLKMDKGANAAACIVISLGLCCCLISGEGYLPLVDKGSANAPTSISRLIFVLENIVSVLTVDIPGKLGFHIANVQANGTLAEIAVATLRFFIGAGIVEWAIVWYKEAYLVERFVATPSECWLRATAVSDDSGNVDVVAEGRVLLFLNKPTSDINEFKKSHHRK